MQPNKQKKVIEELLHHADIKINGDRPFDIQVHNDALYGRVLSQGSLGFGEAYMDGWWDCESIDEMIAHILRAEIQKKVGKGKLALHILKAMFFNAQNFTKAWKVGQVHYDVGNDLYKKMLDDRMVYTCGYWDKTQNLNEAQEAKLDLVCKKIGLKKDDTILDIGCGWGSFVKFAAERYGAKAVGVNNSKEQCKLGKEKCAGLSVEIRLQDYRKIPESEKFDHIVSLGMFEHVGYKNYRQYMEIAERHLKDDGLFLLHTIGGNTSVKATDPWIDKYIFPNSMLPSPKQVTTAIEGLFVMEDWHNFGADYDKTLMAWYDNFLHSWDSLKSQYDERFFRMWKFYLLSCAGSFRSRQNQLWQIVLSKKGVKNGYKRLS
ncbi:MAG: cyclopropane-fatty-acyl-phospholipid synthase [Candidatus Magasanikbacteria bacterium CG11_big_fil_rev_8_21_14_0_20_39_34]|uniref:Cyclopropane-fatty-acyl-phospholipid synthase n=1 Tax=Candidatus Magasanikbacteria bacterium CG11_big_fil_rev_8_21_14_0_20_39_34 TaxID=1974653 RepID=A0A2H0N6W8_9BACT|nr:MAG: cyclopropane-fatty-acyl-phospholipid synthase [Candidatus Magasanikbacteria bacterium CG11_big_fil_rev_8_21_14_0_20_39_34]